MTLSQRTSILHHLCTRADEIREGLDPNLLPDPFNADGWTARLVASLGCVAMGDEEGVSEYHLIDHDRSSAVSQPRTPNSPPLLPTKTLSFTISGAIVMVWPSSRVMMSVAGAARA